MIDSKLFQLESLKKLKIELEKSYLKEYSSIKEKIKSYKDRLEELEEESQQKKKGFPINTKERRRNTLTKEIEKLEV